MLTVEAGIFLRTLMLTSSYSLKKKRDDVMFAKTVAEMYGTVPCQFCRHWEIFANTNTVVLIVKIDNEHKLC